MNTRDWNIPIIPATVTKIEVPEPPVPPRWIMRYYVPQQGMWFSRCSSDVDKTKREIMNFHRDCGVGIIFHLIDTQPEPQPAENAAVIAELEKLVPKMCQCCASGYELRSTAVGDYYHAHRGGNSTSHCFSSSVHARIAELVGEKP